MVDQFEVGTWAVRTFPQATTKTIISHLIREVQELVSAATEGPQDEITRTIDLAREAADIYLLLLHLAHRRDFSLDAFATEKFRVNQARTWGQPDAEGVVEHVRDRAGEEGGDDRSGE